MKDKLHKLIAVFAILAAVTFGAQAPASAAASDCPSGRICLFDAVNYGTLIWSATPGAVLAAENDCISLPASANNKASSVYVRAALVNTVLTLWDNGAQGNRGISTSNYMDANMLTSPGIASFSNVTTTVCATAS